MEFKDARDIQGYSPSLINTIQNELINTIKEGGLTPSKTSEKQLFEAIKNLIETRLSSSESSQNTKINEEKENVKNELKTLLLEESNTLSDLIESRSSSLLEEFGTVKESWKSLSAEMNEYRDKLLKIKVSNKTQKAICDFTSIENKREEKEIKCDLSVEYFHAKKPILLKVNGQFKTTDDRIKKLFEKSTKRTASFILQLASLGIPKEGWAKPSSKGIELFNGDLIVLNDHVTVDQTGKFELTITSR